MIKAKNKSIITEDMPISDLVEQHPEVTDILVYDYGLHCVGCIIAEYETIAEGVRAHGYDEKTLKQLLKDINKRIKSKKD